MTIAWSTQDPIVWIKTILNRVVNMYSWVTQDWRPVVSIYSCHNNKVLPLAIIKYLVERAKLTDTIHLILTGRSRLFIINRYHDSNKKNVNPTLEVDMYVTPWIEEDSRNSFKISISIVQTSNQTCILHCHIPIPTSVPQCNGPCKTDTEEVKGFSIRFDWRR